MTSKETAIKMLSTVLKTEEGIEWLNRQEGNIIDCTTEEAIERLINGDYITKEYKLTPKEIIKRFGHE